MKKLYTLALVFLVTGTLKLTAQQCNVTFQDSVSFCTGYFYGNANPAVNGLVWTWNFGDGTTGTGQNPVHTYAQNGTYTVCVTIMNNFNCQASSCHNVVVNSCANPPNCQVNFADSIANCDVYFNGNAFGANVNTWLWTFGDGGTSNQQSPVHTYTQNGTYLVCLNISTGNCQAQYCDSVVITNCGGNNGGNCMANFSYQVNMCNVQFTNQSQGGTAWAWDFGDGSTSALQNPGHQYAQNGTYTVCLVISNPNGLPACSDTICQNVTIMNCGGIGGNCTANFAFQSQGCAGYFTNLSQGGGFWSWTFGDGGTSNAQNPTHTFPQNGVYYVCLTNYDNAGCQATFCDSVVITNCAGNGGNGNCTAGFNFTANGCTVTFTNTSNGNVNTFYSWTFGDNTGGNGMNQVHQYGQSGVYTVCLTMVDSAMNCSDSICQQVTVNCGGNGVGIHEGEAAPYLLSVYPNPLTASATISFTLERNELVSIKVTDLVGKDVFATKPESRSAGAHSVLLDATHMAPGIYFVRLDAGEGSAVRKIVILE